MDQVRSMLKNKQDNDLIDRIGVVYTKNEIELLLSIGSSTVYDENQIGQRSDWSYRCGLHWKQILVVVTHQTGYILYEN